MFTGLASFSMKGLWQARLIAATTLVLALLFPLFVWLSGAFVALVFLRKGFLPGLQVILIAGIGASLFTWFATGSALVVLAPALLFWVPTAVISLVLRNTVVLANSFLVAAVLGFLIVIGMFLWHSDPSSVWLQAFDEMGLVADLPAQITVDPETVEGFLTEISRLMTVSLAGMVVLSALISMLLARVWQATLYNPGGFGKEFRLLHLGQVPALIAVLVAALSMAVQNDILLALFVVVLCVYLFQGLAVFHALIVSRSMSKGWLFGLYILLVVLLPQMAVLLSTVGVSDTWLNWRQRFAK